ncbi:CCR4-NOT transcription complex subunit 6-like [Mactra antiquata]
MQKEIPVKRVSVSAAVELFRDEVPSLSMPSVYTDTVPTCKKCQRERNRNRDFRQNKKTKRKQNRANTPIVIQLKDTLKAAILQKQKTRKNLLQKQESNETRDEGDVETDNSSDKSDIVCKVNKQRKNVKNLSAFIEKSAKKDTTNSSYCNLSRENPFHDKFVAEYVLNNITNSHLPMKVGHKKNIVECENVDVICNDLNSIESTVEDTEESEISSTTSSSEIQSDSDISNPHDSPQSQEFTSDELRQLAEFTTGCPLVRYDCAPSNCPQCLWYKAQADLSKTHKNQHAQPYHSTCTSKHQHTYRHGRRNKSKKFAQQNQRVPSPRVSATVKVKNISNNESDVEEATTDSPSESSNDTDTLSPEGHSPVSKHGSFNWSDQCETYYQPMQLLDIDFAGKHSKSSHYSTNNEPYIDGVYIDLTNTDVTFSVYYHHNLNDESSMYSGSYNDYTSSNVTGIHHQDYLPYNSVPYFQQYLYWSTYYAPMCSIPMPLCLQPDESLPKTAMVPPEELAKFNTSSPPPRQWIPLARPEPGRPAAIFTTMCYNVLCDKYCTRQQYGYCPSWGLNWEYRKKGIMEEIRQCSADIIGLQEVETDQFYNFFKPELERDGYQGIFSPKSRARTMTEQERKHVDGCAIFFRTSKFSLVKEHLIEFNQLAMANAEGSDEMLNRVMTKDNIGLAALLETREGVFDSSGGLPPEDKIKQPLLITTAHMHWDPEYSDVKLIQTMMLMSELKKVVEESYQVIRPDEQMIDCNSIPMILCGDLNSLPESGVIEYLSTGRVASNHIDFKELGYEACLQAFNCHKDSTHLTHKFRLAKAYEDNIMRHTNYTFEFKGIIDYIFFSRSYMNLLGVLGPMDENWFHDNKVVGCPHPHIPSDHFSLFVEFEMPVPYPDINTILSDDVPVTSNTGNNLGAIGSSRDKHHR